MRETMKKSDLDVGDKTIGVAVSDELGHHCSGRYDH